MEEKLVRVNWKRGQYSDIDRSDVIDPSPLKAGQKVKVIWGDSGKEYTATIDRYPVLTDRPHQKTPDARRNSKAKRKLVSEN